MRKILEDIFHAGIGLTAVTKEQLEKIFNELKERGEVQEKDRELFLSKFIDKLEKTGHTVSEKIKKMVSPDSQKIDELNQKIDELVKEIERLKKQGKSK
jgi:polyhydroxyalkanoate synthesis regulator phasin